MEERNGLKLERRRIGRRGTKGLLGYIYPHTRERKTE